VRPFAQALEALDASSAPDMAAALEEGLEVEIEIAAEAGAEVLRVGPEHIEVRREPAEGTAFAYEPPFGISLELELTPELKRQGFVREFVHQAQMLRRELGLEVTDRVVVRVGGGGDAVDALREYEDYVTEELLATSVDHADAGAGKTITVDGTQLSVSLEKVREEESV
jgi:isoleucyl-tRNA synthetase